MDPCTEKSQAQRWALASGKSPPCVSGASSIREAQFGEETCLSALPSNSTLVSLKSFLIVPARKQKYYPASPQKLDNQNDISDKIWGSIALQELDGSLGPLCGVGQVKRFLHGTSLSRDLLSSPALRCSSQAVTLHSFQEDGTFQRA